MMKDGLTDRACSKCDKAARVTAASTESTADGSETKVRSTGSAVVNTKMAICKATNAMMAP